MSMKLRMGFLGVGAMGLSHVNQFHVKLGARAQAVAICSRSEANVKKALAIAPDARVFRDEKELIHADLDAVVISTPNATHLELALETLKAGKHLFLEKPCGITREECQRLLDASRRTDRVVMIGHELRYSPFFQKIKALVDAGEIGAPRMVWTREFRGPFQPKSGQWIQDARMSGGMMVDKNCHHFDMMNWWAGARPVRVSAFGGLAVNHVIDGPHQVNDHATVSYSYENGVLGTLHVCLFARDFPHEDLQMGIVGDKGELRTRIIPPGARANTPHPASGHPLPSSDEGRGQGEGRSRSSAPTGGVCEILQWKSGSGTNEPVVHRVAAVTGEGWGNHLGFDEIHAAFLDAVLDGKRPLTTVEDCVDGSLLAIAAEESIRKRESVQVI
jgi:predicted dehydrogenase